MASSFFSKLNHIRQAGLAAILATLAVLGLVVITVSSLTLITLTEKKIAGNTVYSAQAYYAAESGIEDSLYRVIKGKNYQATNFLTVASSTAAINISGDSVKTIRINGQENNRWRNLQVILNVSQDAVSFHYGVQVGEGGLMMENNSQILGNVYSNGSIQGDSGAVITGDAWVATGMSQNQAHTTFNSDQIFGQANPLIDVVQSFKPSFSDALVKVSIYIKKIGDPGDRTIRILTDSAGSPSKTSLAAATLRSNLVGTTYGWVDIVFSSPPNLTQGTTYWLLIDATKDSNDYWFWGKDQNQGYPNGQAKYTQDWNGASPSWTTISGDLNFKIFMGGQITSLDKVIVNGQAHANTITNSKICGDAYYQIIDSSLNFLNNPSKPTCPEPLTPGTAYPGSVDPPLQNMPISDSNIAQWKQEAAEGGVQSGDLFINADMSFGPKKIDGNLVMTSNNKTLTVTGTIYVTGYIDIDNGSTIRCAASYGLNSCVVVADQWVHVKNNGVFSGSGQPGSYILVLSTSPCDGSSSTNCTDHNAAVDLHNNATGAIFYAGGGLIYLHNGIDVSELTAKKIQLGENAIIRYEQGLANASFSSGPGATWAIASWQEVP